MVKKIKILSVILILLFSNEIIARDNPQFLQRINEPTVGYNSGYFVESPTSGTKGKWSGRVHSSWISPAQFNYGSSQVRLDLGVGFQLTSKLLVSMDLPLFTNIYKNRNYENSVKISVGDFRTGLLWTLVDSKKKGVGLMIGILGYIPTGNAARGAGDDAFSLLSFVSAGIQVFSASLTLNLGYRWRTGSGEYWFNDNYVPYSDDMTWAVGVRVKKREDIIWSIEGKGTVAIDSGFNEEQAVLLRSSWLGAGLDYPVKDERRLGLFAGILLPVHNNQTGFMLSVTIKSGEIILDKDNDLILKKYDKCPLLREDIDGFEDEDGCPDLDNDKDGIPDKEDPTPNPV